MPLSIIKDLGGVRLSYMLRNVIFDDILVGGGQSLFILHLAGLTVQQTDY